MTLRERLDRISRHPTGATVIGGLILAGLLTALAQIWSALRAVAESPPHALTTQLGLAWHWLSADIPIPRGLALLSGVTIGCLFGLAGRYWLTAVKVAKRAQELTQHVRKASDALKVEVQELARSTEEAKREVAQAVAARPKPPVAPTRSALRTLSDLPAPRPPLELTAKHRHALAVLLGQYPNSMARNDLIRRMGGEFRPNERVLLQLEEHDLVKIVPNPWHGVQIALLPEGADFCEEQGIRRA
jgi:hypothetical protein